MITGGGPGRKAFRRGIRSDYNGATKYKGGASGDTEWSQPPRNGVS
jgi:hypothetical protein